MSSVGATGAAISSTPSGASMRVSWLSLVPVERGIVFGVR